jgi:hypothetical protein
VLGTGCRRQAGFQHWESCWGDAGNTSLRPALRTRSWDQRWACLGPVLGRHWDRLGVEEQEWLRPALGMHWAHHWATLSTRLGDSWVLHWATHWVHHWRCTRDTAGTGTGPVLGVALESTTQRELSTPVGRNRPLLDLGMTRRSLGRELGAALGPSTRRCTCTGR